MNGHGQSRPTARGSRVKLRAETIKRTRTHLLSHAKHGDVGTVIEQPGVGSQWMLVRFDRCEQVHRVADDEVVPHR